MSSHRISVVPLLAGTGLFVGACALLCEDALHGHWHLNHALQPLLMLGTIVAGVLAHHRLASLKVSGLAFLFLAVVGSGAVIYATLSRTATARDTQAADAMAMNRTLTEKREALDAAKASAKVECRKMGPLCQQWQSRIDVLTREMAPLKAVAVDPRSDAIGRLADLLDLDGARVRAVVAALDPVILPLFLEAGCILFFAAAFPHRRRNRVQSSAIEPQPLNQKEIAKVWGVHPSTAGRRLKALEAQGRLQRVREGKAVIALPAPR